MTLEDIDALITNFETLSNTSVESCPIDEEEAVRTLVTWKESRLNLNVVKRDRNFSQNSILRRQRQILSKFAEGRDASAVVALDTSARLSRTSLKKPVSHATVLVTRDDLSARRQAKTLDELLLENEKLSQERAPHVSVQSDDEEETCLLLHEPGKAIIDTGCGRCVIGALTLEAHQSVMGDQAKEIVLAL